MRQFFTLRFWLTIAALAGLALAAAAFVKSREEESQLIQVPGGTDRERTVDLVAWVYSVQPAPGFEIVNGLTTTDLALVLDGTRTMVVKAGTPGEMNCPRSNELAQCTVAADLLGDGVLWFSLVPGVPGPTVELPGVTDLLDGGWLRLANGWVVRHDDVVDRSCPEDTASLTEFIEQFGGSARSTWNFEQQQIVKVTCPREPVATTTTVPGATTTIPPIGGEPIPTTVAP